MDFNVTDQGGSSTWPTCEPSLLRHQQAPSAALAKGRDGSVRKGSSSYIDKAERANLPLKIWQQTGFIANHFSAACKTKKLSEIPPT